MVSGDLAERLSAALRAAFTVDELRLLLRYRLDKQLDDITLAKNYEALAFDVVEAAGRGQWLPGLVDAACEKRPGNSVLAGIREELSQSPGRAPDRGSPAASGHPRLGELLFQARLARPAGQFAIGFSADDTLVVVGPNAAVHRWSLANGADAGGLPPGERLSDSTQVAVATSEPALAFRRSRKLTVTQLRGGGARNVAGLTLEKDEFIVRGGGAAFATHNGRRVAVRDFRDGAVRWEYPCPPSLAATILDATGTVVAVADGRLGARGNKVTVGSQEQSRLYEVTLGNVPFIAPGCVLGLSPRGELLAASSFHEVVLDRPHAGEVVFRHALRGFRESVPVAGARPQRLLPLPDGTVLWLRGRRVVAIRADSEDLHYLPQEGDVDDIAFDYPRSRLALVNASGLVSVWRWAAEKSQG